MNAPVRTEQADGVATLTLDAPERRNGLSPEMVEAVIAALGALDGDASVRCIVLTGAGSAFSAGGDPRRMVQPGLYDEMSPSDLSDFYRRGIQKLPLALATVETPIVAAVNGPAIGAGCDLACYCDLRIASDRASFASSFVRLGLVPGDGGAWVLPRVIGMARALEMMLTGDPVDAEAALRAGLVSSVVAHERLLDEAGALARRIANNPPLTVRLTKRLAGECRDLPLAAALDVSAAYQVLTQKTADHVEAVHALLEKRAPTFTGR